jgi:hypothetical protein
VRPKKQLNLIDALLSFGEQEASRTLFCFRRQFVPLSAALAQFSYTDPIRAVPD